MVLLAAVTLLSVAVAGVAGSLEPASAASSNAPAYTSSAAPPSAVEKQSVRLTDQAPVRVIGAPFVPNTNPRER